MLKDVTAYHGDNFRTCCKEPVSYLSRHLLVLGSHGKVRLLFLCGFSPLFKRAKNRLLDWKSILELFNSYLFDLLVFHQFKNLILV